MSSFRTLACFAVLGLAAAGCKNSYVKAAEDYEGQACRCETAVCANDATKKFEMGDLKPSTGSNGDVEAFSKAVAHAHECVAKVASASSGAAAKPPSSGEREVRAPQ